MANRTFLVVWRIAILKMNVLPRLLYLFQAISITLPPSFFLSYKWICRNLVRSSKAPRPSWERLTLPKLRGGLNLPDIQKHHWACLLTRIVDWHIHEQSKDWVQLEKSFAQTPVHHFPWINRIYVPKDFTLHSLIHATLVQFRTACKKLNLHPTPGPMTPLDNNPEFPPGLSLHVLTETPPRTQIRAQQFFHNNKLMSHQEMSNKFPEYNILSSNSYKSFFFPGFKTYHCMA